jgi:hypothetical protein
VVILAVPTGPSTIISISNSTKVASPALMFNNSGGFISTFNLTVSVQDSKWKAFVGNVSSSFTLSDGTGSTLYNWQSATTTGRIYATRNSSAINWPAVACANSTTLGNESIAMVLNTTTAPSDMLNMTFNMTPGNNPFFVGQVLISANTCPTLLTYVNNNSQSATTFFQEVPLYITTSNPASPTIIYESPIQGPAQVGYNGQFYNFQMLVPENGTVGYSSSTAYYMYLELGT